MSGDTLRKAIVPILLIVVITLVACYYITESYKDSQKEKKTVAANEENEESLSDEIVDMETLEYEFSGILIDKNVDDMSITLRPVESGKDVLLTYDGTTSFFGRHGNSISLEQLSLGEIVSANYSIHSGKLKTLKISDKAWSQTDISRFDINEKKKSMTIGEETFKIDNNLVISYGQELAELMDVTQQDTLSVRGIDRRICSIIVEHGHGYLRLKNDAYFVDGFIEIGTDIVKKVTSEMLIPVPEGTYNVRLTHKGYAAEKKIAISRDKEEVLDLDEVEIQEVAIGHVQFKIEPDYAQLYIDDEMTEFEERVPIEYGIHSIHVELAGYESVDTNIKVSSEYADVDITLEEKAEDTSSSSSAKKTSTEPVDRTTTAGETSSSSGTNLYNAPSSTMHSNEAFQQNESSSSSSSMLPVISETRQIYVEAPQNAEVYLDGSYIGIAPCRTNKVTGQHVLTLSKAGYNTKSYTINVDSDDRDVTFSFSDLIATEHVE